MTPSWLNFVLAVPTVGVQVEPNPRVMFHYPDLLLPLMDRLRSKELEATIDARKPPTFVIDVSGGYTYRFTNDNIVIEFKYPMQVSKQPGSIPHVAEQSIRGFDDLLSGAVVEMETILEMLTRDHPLAVRRVGIVADTDLSPESIPPGLQALIKHLGAPWGRPLDKCQTVLLARLRENDRSVEQCHHTLKFDYTDDVHHTEIMLDWQRVYTKPIGSNRRSADDRIPAIAEAAQAYFRRIGEEGLGLG